MSNAAWYEAPDAWLLSVLPSMTSVTSAMWACAALRWDSFDSSTMASVRSSRSRSRRANLRSAYCRTRSGTSRFLPLTIVLTGDLPAPVRLAVGRGSLEMGSARTLSIATDRRSATGPQAPADESSHRSRATVMALTAVAPPARIALAVSQSVAPVVTTSSTRTTQRPAMAARAAGSIAKASATLDAR